MSFAMINPPGISFDDKSLKMSQLTSNPPEAVENFAVGSHR